MMLLAMATGLGSLRNAYVAVKSSKHYMVKRGNIFRHSYQMANNFYIWRKAEERSGPNWGCHRRSASLGSCNLEVLRRDNLLHRRNGEFVYGRNIIIPVALSSVGNISVDRNKAILGQVGQL